jgi:hypothetical protein
MKNDIFLQPNCNKKNILELIYKIGIRVEIKVAGNH